MPARTIRIAVLECDTPPDQTNSKYGGYHGVFSKFLRESADALAQTESEALHDHRDGASGRSGPALDISRWDVINAQAYPALEDVDAIVVSGSKQTSFESPPWILKLVKFMQRALKTPHIRTLGICFGHQIVARTLGMPVTRNPAGWEIAVCPVELTSVGKSIFGVEQLNIHQMHRDAVTPHPCSPESPSLKVKVDYNGDILPLGHSDICEVQGLYSPGRFITVQGHPEFRTDIVEEIVTLRTKEGVFDPVQAEDALSRAAMDHDGIKVGVAFLRMVVGG